MYARRADYREVGQMKQTVEHRVPLTRAEEYVLNDLADNELLLTGKAGEEIGAWFVQTGHDYFLRGCDPQVFVERALALEALVVRWIREEWAYWMKPDAHFDGIPDIEFTKDGYDGLIRRLRAAGRAEGTAPLSEAEAKPPQRRGGLIERVRRGAPVEEIVRGGRPRNGRREGRA
jgi:hypothetical protein